MPAETKVPAITCRPGRTVQTASGNLTSCNSGRMRTAAKMSRGNPAPLILRSVWRRRQTVGASRTNPATCTKASENRPGAAPPPKRTERNAVTAVASHKSRSPPTSKRAVVAVRRLRTLAEEICASGDARNRAGYWLLIGHCLGS